MGTIFISICVTWIIAQLVGMKYTDMLWRKSADTNEPAHTFDGFTYLVIKRKL
jgi:hypothetical protein